MRILVLGGDGYLGWPSVLHLLAAGHDVQVIDNLARRVIDRELGTSSLVPIEEMQDRVQFLREQTGTFLQWAYVDVNDYEGLFWRVNIFKPHAIVHLAEQRSAPYSMMGRKQAFYTQQNNVLGTLNLIYVVAQIDPTIHIVKLGTMGEYGTPNIDIEEGWLDVKHNGRIARVLYPKRPGSWYHLSKVHDSHNLEFACRAWGLRVTDLNQGVVYGNETEQTALDPRMATRFDYDAVFGTVLNRFAVQAALKLPLTVYGSGTQKRGFIDLRDSVKCIELACLNPAKPGEFRVFNQMTETFSVLELAEWVQVLSCSLGKPVGIDHLNNPRVEQSEHYYNVKHSNLTALGLNPNLLSEATIQKLLDLAYQYRERIDPAVILPRVNWRLPQVSD